MASDYTPLLKKELEALKALPLDLKVGNPQTHLVHFCQRIAIALYKGMLRLSEVSFALKKEDLAITSAKTTIWLNKMVVENFDWKRSQWAGKQPAVVTLTIIGGKPHLDISGPIGPIIISFIDRFVEGTEDVDYKDPATFEIENERFSYDV